MVGIWVLGGIEERKMSRVGEGKVIKVNEGVYLLGEGYFGRFYCEGC